MSDSLTQLHSGSKHRLKILYIAGRADIGGGGEVYLQRLFARLDRSRFIPIVLLPGIGSVLPVFESQGIEVHVLELELGWIKPDEPWYRYLVAYPKNVRNLVELILNKDIRLVHTHSNSYFEGALAARIVGIPHIYHCHIEYQPDMPIFERMPLGAYSFAALMGELSDHVVTVSDALVELLSPPIPREKITVIPNGVDIEAFQRELEESGHGLKESLGIPDKALVVICIGRIAFDKGVHTYLDACGLVAARYPDVHFLHVGPEDNVEYAKALKIRANAPDLARRFHFLGFRQDIPGILAQTDLFVLSSTREGGPYVLVEAMLANNACVSTRCGGLIPDLIQDGKTGLLVDVGDAINMSLAIERLLTNADLCNKIAKVAREQVVTKFHVAQTVNRLEEVYETAFSSPFLDKGHLLAEVFIQSLGELGILGSRVMRMEHRLTALEAGGPLRRLARRTAYLLKRVVLIGLNA